MGMQKSNKESDERGDRCPLGYAREVPDREASAREVPDREASSVLYVLGDKPFTCKKLLVRF